jgi:hypothetical protein
LSGGLQLKTGHTFFIPNTGGAANPSGSHLFVCMTARNKEANSIIVPITSLHNYSDQSCVLHVGDHRFIRQDSCVSYDFAQILPAGEIEARIADQTYATHDPVSDAVWIRLLVGFVTSDEVEPRIYEAMRGEMLKKWLIHKGHLPKGS